MFQLTRIFSNIKNFEGPTTFFTIVSWQAYKADSFPFLVLRNWYNLNKEVTNSFTNFYARICSKCNTEHFRTGKYLFDRGKLT
jgi:hypothetical protein